MKKGIVIFVFLISLSLFSQEKPSIEVELNIGAPIGKVDFPTEFVMGIKINYLFEVSRKLFLGPSISYNYFFAENNNSFSSASILPIALNSGYELFKGLSVDLDLGYALGITNAEGGEFYFRPGLGINLGKHIKLEGFYSDAGFYKYAGLGLSYCFR